VGEQSRTVYVSSCLLIRCLGPSSQSRAWCLAAILFGLEECASLVDTKQQVDEILEFLTGKQIAIKDLFRLGRYKKKSGTPAHASRPRPVLIKLSTAWDRRIVLMSKRKLKGFHIAHLFLREDLPIGLRRPKRPLLSEVDHGYTSPSDIPDVSLQHEPVATVSGGVSQAASDSPHRGDSDSTLTSTQTTNISLDTSVSNLNLARMLHLSNGPAAVSYI